MEFILGLILGVAVGYFGKTKIDSYIANWKIKLEKKTGTGDGQ